MPTLKQLRKAAIESGMADDMARLGFSLGHDFWFYRWRGEYLDVIGFSIKSSKKWVKVPVVCFVEELVDDDYDMSGFPKRFLGRASNLTGLYIDDDGLQFIGHAMEIATDAQVEQMLKHVVKTVQMEVDPWFKAITTRAALFETISPRLREGEKGERIVKKLGLID